MRKSILNVFFSLGNVANLLSDMQELRPTIFATVPRLLNKFYDSIQTKVKKNGSIINRIL